MKKISEEELFISQMNPEKEGKSEIAGTLIETEGLINCFYIRCKSIPNTIVGKRCTVTAGYIPLQQRLENYDAAGKMLMDIRNSEYPETYREGELLDDEFFDLSDDPVDIINRGNYAEEKLSRRSWKEYKKWDRSEQSRKNLVNEDTEEQMVVQEESNTTRTRGKKGTSNV